ncbi:MAG: hypothetical protein AMK70_02400 [Nitrospira bacterium SG8_35_1]|nr:MAG: hypothetical protein AMK70_02400 [Nitrospira bacterium SG8_35_1]
MNPEYSKNDPETDEILGITRCARCGHRLEGEIDCPVCSGFDDTPRREGMPKWIYLTACFLTSPLSLYFLLKTDKLTIPEKIIAFSGCAIWFLIYRITHHFRL